MEGNRIVFIGPEPASRAGLASQHLTEESALFVPFNGSIVRLADALITMGTFPLIQFASLDWMLRDRDEFA